MSKCLTIIIHMRSRSDYPVHGKPHSVGKLTIIQMQIFLSGNRSGRGLPEQFFVNGGRHTGTGSFLKLI